MSDETIARKPIFYRDFNLRFAYYDAAAGTYKVWVEGETPGGTMSPSDAVICTYDPKDFWKDPVLGTGGPLAKLDRRSLEREELFALGQRLADMALPNAKVRPLFEKSLVALDPNQGLRLRLHIDEPELAQLPWEYMMVPQTAGEPQETDFLVLRREISIVRTDTVESAARDLPEQTPRIVGVFSAPMDQHKLDVGKDKDALNTAINALNKAAGRDCFQTRWVEKPATRTKMEEALQDGADLFQFSGHALFELHQEGKLILELSEEESDPYPAGKLAQLLRDAGVRLAMLSACETGRRNGQMVWSGVAPALTREKIPAVVANQFDILDTNAILLSAKIYPRLIAGFSIDEALFEARKAIFQNGELKDRDWGAVVLYLQDNQGVLFKMPEKSTGQSSAQGPFLEVANTFKKVFGHVIDVELGKVTGGRIKVSDTIDVVAKGATFTSVKIDKFGP